MKVEAGKKKLLNYNALVGAISQVHRQAQAGAASAVNRHLVLRNWVIGAYIVEYEQNGEDRARYGTGLLKRLSVIERARKQGGRAPAAIAELIRDPYLLEFAGLAEKPRYTENDLESALLDHIQNFLLMELQRLIETDRAAWEQQHINTKE